MAVELLVGVLVLSLGCPRTNAVAGPSLNLLTVGQGLSGTEVNEVGSITVRRLVRTPQGSWHCFQHTSWS